VTITRSCRRELEVQQASKSGRWTHELRAHASACEACRQVALVTEALAGDSTTVPRRIAPSIVWAKARHARARRAETLASQILVGAQLALGVAGLVALAYAGMLATGWPALGAAFGRSEHLPILLAGAGFLAVVGVATARLLTRES